ncbi:MAG: hypothetical protein ACKO7P_15690 [Bacteroidota bacterium]
MTFPVYRKLSNEKSYYKIVSADSFIELQKIGDKIRRHIVIAQQFPEKLRIQDMISLADGFLSCDETEFESINRLVEN